ncbi:hypothetical protein [Rhizorhapis sp. SPR117]|uniref:hypothetical protein n=1 Tax=Rhizorhapis sp. SPR117 TaxID=2912611 RepID=UPI001F372483
MNQKIAVQLPDMVFSRHNRVERGEDRFHHFGVYLGGPARYQRTVLNATLV